MSSCSASTSRNPERTDSPTSSGWASRGRASPTTTVASPCRTACSVRRKRSSSGPTGSSRDGTSARSTRRPSSPPSRSSAGRPRHDESPSPHRDRGPRACGRARVRGASARDHGRRAGGSDHDRAQMSGLSRPFGEGLDVGDGSPDARPRRTARARARRAGGGRGRMTIALFVVLLLAGTAAVIAPLARRPLAWPADPPDQRDDVARAVSSLRDLEFARAAGTIATEDYVRLRASLERDAFVRRPPESRGNVAADRVIAQRPKDPDALFVKGLALYRKQDWNGAVDVWTVYLDVGHYHFGSDMVRGLYADARTKAAR